MAVNLKRLVYFDSFMDPIANAILEKRDDIDLVRLIYDTAEVDNWSEMVQAHGYQVQGAASCASRSFPRPSCWRAAPTCSRSVPRGRATT